MQSWLVAEVVRPWLGYKSPPGWGTSTPPCSWGEVAFLRQDFVTLSRLSQPIGDVASKLAILGSILSGYMVHPVGL